MLPVQFDAVGPDDILDLIRGKISERRHLEYKRDLNIGPDNDRAEFLADISSFANASGGDIIFGVTEERDEYGRPTGIPEDVAALQTGNVATECARIEQIIESGIEPRIPGIQVKSIEIPGKGMVILARVRKSWIAPHMVTFKNRARFYSRNGTGKFQLDVQQIGAAFALQRGLGERVQAWRAERVAKVISGESPMPLSGSVVLFHFIPSASLVSDSIPLPRVFDTSAWGGSQKLLADVMPQSSRYNADGLVMALHRENKGNQQSYLQVFRDGRLEYGDSYQMSIDHQVPIASGCLEREIADTFVNGYNLLEKLEVEEPIFVTMSLIGMKGREMALPERFLRRRYLTSRCIFDRDVILCPDVQMKNVGEGYPYSTTLLPLINSMWQAAGLKQSPFIHDDGSWDPGA